MEENSIFLDYVKLGKIQELEQEVRKQLPQRFNFKCCIYSLDGSGVIAYFMPCFNLYFNLDANTSLMRIVSLISSKYDVEDITVLNGKAVLNCTSSDLGPYAETVDEILQIIQFHHGPHLLETLAELNLDCTRIEFLLYEVG